MSVSESSAGAIENTLRSYVGLSGTVTGSTPVTESEAGAIENLLRSFTGLPQVDIQGGGGGGASLNVIDITMGESTYTTKTAAEIRTMVQSGTPIWLMMVSQYGGAFIPMADIVYDSEHDAAQMVGTMFSYEGGFSAFGIQMVADLAAGTFTLSMMPFALTATAGEAQTYNGTTGHA